MLKYSVLKQGKQDVFFLFLYKLVILSTKKKLFIFRLLKNGASKTYKIGF